MDWWAARLTRGGVLGRANADDADVLCAGGTEQVLGCGVRLPWTLSTFLRSFCWGHVRQLDLVSREVLARLRTVSGCD